MPHKSKEAKQALKDPKNTKKNPLAKLLAEVILDLDRFEELYEAERLKNVALEKERNDLIAKTVLMRQRRRSIGRGGRLI